ncbi:MAG: hypothetical protein F2924_00010 [Actinobacteria bacterium]|uniref:Unannotated protein n=1 Tax=freshwater metagenome TaxID=449393 RepID=A0A6J7SBW4_9ZZZZ|nr:hypothetical protein [Actinomycetota bacterium]
MKKIIAAFLIVFMQSLCVVNLAFAGDFTYDIISQKLADELTTNISSELAPGDYEMNVSVENADGTSELRNFLYCKDADGNILWNQWCTGETPLIDPVQLQDITVQSELPTYSPKTDVQTVQDIAVSTFAVLSYLTVGLGHAMNLTGGAPVNDGGSNTRAELAELELKILERSKKRRRFGDLLGMWNKSIFTFMDSTFVNVSKRVSGFSPAITRSTSDASYLRAMTGSLSLILYPIALFLGFLALNDTNFQALPPTATTLIAVLMLGVFDSFAGLLSGLVFFTGCLITGHISTIHELLISIGLLAFSFCPILLSSNLRPIRRHVFNSHDMWERITDYCLGTILTVWIISQMVDALPGLAGLQLSIVSQWKTVCIFGGIAILLRRFLEDIALNQYPERLEKTELVHPSPTVRQRLSKACIQIAIFAFLGHAFIGTSLAFWLGVVLFAVPKLTSVFSEELPKSHSLVRIVPNAAIKIVAVLIAGGGISYYYLAGVSDAQTRINVGFYLLILPGSLISVLGLLSKKEETDDEWKYSGLGKIAYRFFGTLVFVVLALNTFKVDVFGKLFHFFS